MKKILLLLLFLSCFFVSLSHAAPKKLTKEEKDVIQTRTYHKPYDEAFDIIAKNMRREFDEMEEIDKATGYASTLPIRYTERMGFKGRKKYTVAIDKISDDEISVKATIKKQFFNTDNQWWDIDIISNIKTAPEGTKEYNAFFEIIEKGLN